MRKAYAQFMYISCLLNIAFTLHCKIRSVPLQSRFLYLTSTDTGRIGAFVTLSAHSTAHICNEEPGAQAVWKSISLKDPESTTKYIYFCFGRYDQTWHKSPFPGCRGEVQPCARSHTCCLPASPG